MSPRATPSTHPHSVAVKVVGGQADRLPLEDESVDAAVSSLVLCAVSEQATPFKRCAEVLRRGGELRIYEHVVAHNRIGLALARGADATFWPRAFGNCHATRDTQTAIEQAGFAIDQNRRLRRPKVETPDPHIIGIARRK